MIEARFDTEALTSDDNQLRKFVYLLGAERVIAIDTVPERMALAEAIREKRSGASSRLIDIKS